MTYELVIGIAAATAIIAYISFKLDEKHFLLQLLFLFFCMGLLVILPSAVVNEQQCSWNINGTVTAGNNITYINDWVCKDTSNPAQGTFFKTMLWLLRLFITYVILYTGYHALFWLKERVSG